MGSVQSLEKSALAISPSKISQWRLRSWHSSAGPSGTWNERYAEEFQGMVSIVENKVGS